MEKILSKYETMFIVDVSGGEEATAAVVEKFKSLIPLTEFYHALHCHSILP